MDKVAGEIAYLYLESNDEPFLFESIIVYGLILDLQADRIQTGLRHK